MKSLLATVFTVLISIPSTSQNRFNLSAGLGFPDFIMIGAGYQIKQLEVDASFGFWPFILFESLTDFSGGVNYRFGKSGPGPNSLLWSAGLRVIAVSHSGDYFEFADKYLFLNPHIERDFMLSDQLGLSLEAGIAFALKAEEKGNTPVLGWLLRYDAPVLPSLDLRLFYRL